MLRCLKTANQINKEDKLFLRILFLKELKLQKLKKLNLVLMRL